MSEKNRVELAKLAEAAERYDDMAKHMCVFVNNTDTILTDEQRNFLSVAYKNKVGARRSSWRILFAEEQKLKNEEEKTFLAEYMAEVKRELTGICDEVITLLRKTLIPKAKEHDWATDTNKKTEQLVFYYKMMADYYRYQAELDKDDDLITSSKEAYDNAVSAAADLEPTHPIRLGLYLNQSVFYYEIMNKPENACEIAKKAFDDAIAELDQLKEESYKDSTLIMQLLRDNLTLWTTDSTKEDDAD